VALVAGTQISVVSAGPYSEPQPLRTLAADASTVAVARVLDLGTRNGGHAAVHTIAIERIVVGEWPAAPRVQVVEADDASASTGFPPARSEVLVLLRPLRGTPPARGQKDAAFEVVGGRDGVLVLGDDTQRRDAIAAVARARSASTPEEIRKHAFTDLVASHPRLVEDGVVELAHLGGAIQYSQYERSVLTAVLADDSLPEQTRVILIEALGRGRDHSVAGVLAGASTETPGLLGAALHARAALGSPAPDTELATYIHSSNLGRRETAAEMATPRAR